MRNKDKFALSAVLLLTLSSSAYLYSHRTIHDKILDANIEYPANLSQSEKQTLDKYKTDLYYTDSRLLRQAKKIIFTDKTIAEILEEKTGEKMSESEKESYATAKVGGATMEDNHFIYISLSDYGPHLITHELFHVVDLNIEKKVGERPSHSAEFTQLVKENAKCLAFTLYEDSSPEERFVAAMLKAYYWPGETQDKMPEVWNYHVKMMKKIETQ